MVKLLEWHFADKGSSDLIADSSESENVYYIIYDVENLLYKVQVWSGRSKHPWMEASFYTLAEAMEDCQKTEAICTRQF